MNTINTYIGNRPPKNSNTIWLRPLKQGGVGFYVWVNDKWNTIKLMDSKGSRTPMDDTPIDIDGDSDHYYTKDLIDDKFADILGLDAEGIAALKALVEDGDAMTGLLTAVNNKYDKVNGVQLSSKSGDIAPIPFIKVDYGDGIEGSVEFSSGLLKFNGGTGEGSYNLHASFVALTDSTTGKTNPAGIHYPKNGDDSFDDTTIARVCDIPQISTDITTDGTSDTKVTSPKAVKTFVEDKGYITSQDITGKEDVMPITTATGATLTAVVGNYYRLDNVGTLAITLPTITGATKIHAITFLLVCGSSALVTFVPQDSETILYQENFALEADTTYEVTALWNGSEWTLSRIIYE